MKKLPLALAIGSAALMPMAQADDFSVQIYGKLYPYMLSEKGSGATAAGETVSTLSPSAKGVNGMDDIKGLQAGNSRLGLRGKEDLGDGLAALFQLEQTVGVDAGTGGAWNRDTFVGLEGKFGLVRLGNMDTIFKNYGDIIGTLGISSGTFLSTSDVLRKTGFGLSSASSFHLRRANSVTYETPNFYDLQAGIQYSTNEAETTGHNPRLLSVGVFYDKDSWYVGLAHEIHYDFFGGSLNAPSAMRNSADEAVNSKDQATQLAIVYRLSKDHKFEFDAIRKTYKENATLPGRFQSYRNNAFLLTAESRWGERWRTSVHYVRSLAGSCEVVGTPCNTSGLEGSEFVVAGAYNFSKRTFLFGAVERLTNGKSARYSNAEFDHDPNPGEDITQFALGIVHSF